MSEKVNLELLKYLLEGMKKDIEGVGKKVDALKEGVNNCRKEHDDEIDDIHTDVAQLQGCKIARNQDREFHFKRWQAWLVFVGVVITGAIIPLIITLLIK